MDSKRARHTVNSFATASPCDIQH